MKEKYTPIEFPRDDLAHDHIIEWWYFNGRLKDKNGGEYAFMNCLFKADVKKVKIPFLTKVPVKILYFYHALLSDISHKKFYPTVEPATVISEDSFSKDHLFINHANPIIMNGYTNRVIENTGENSWHLKDKNIDITMTSVKKPLLEGGTGFLDLDIKATYYYSLTNLKTEGKIKIQEKWIPVSGKSWMDHQWANTAYSKDKWTWFSIQFDNETEMICFEYENEGVKKYLASISYADNTQVHSTNVILTPLKEKWQSPKTDATYPLEWKIEVPDKNINIKVRALIQEQEMVFGSINYWEGPLSATGTFDTLDVKGDGFMELAGYPSKYTSANYVKDELEKHIAEAFSYTKKVIKEGF